MIREITVQNFKSLEDLHLPLGRVTVLIGENGAGKSNILEAVAFLGAAAQDKLDPEFLHARGVRDSALENTVSLLSSVDRSQDAWRAKRFGVGGAGVGKAKCCQFTVHRFEGRGEAFKGWAAAEGKPDDGKVPGLLTLTEMDWKYLARLGKNLASQLPPRSVDQRLLRELAQSAANRRSTSAIARRLFPTPFVIYSPENTALRTFETEGQMRPLGVRGEGLFKLVQRFAEESPERFKALRKELKLFDWFSDFNIPKRLGLGESRLDIKDRFLAAKHLLDQRSANEGFLFVLFYICLFLSPQTPKFFAIDNIDASLNPKLCAELMRRIVALAKQEDKQVIITTHNPAILDGLDLKDKEQMLYAVQRDSKGRTVAKRIEAPKPQRGEPALKLSHAYLRGLIGGLPKNF